jgi:hypothetical protein
VSPQIFLMVSPFGCGCANAAGVTIAMKLVVVSAANASRLTVPNIRLILVVRLTSFSY